MNSTEMCLLKYIFYLLTILSSPKNLPHKKKEGSLPVSILKISFCYLFKNTPFLPPPKLSAQALKSNEWRLKNKSKVSKALANNDYHK